MTMLAIYARMKCIKYDAGVDDAHDSHPATVFS
jgi:hypothetical protein